MEKKTVGKWKVFNINNLCMVLNIVLSIFIVLINNINIDKVIVSIILIITFFFVKDYQKVFFMFLITSCAWGASINLNCRFGNIMPSDFFMIALCISMFIGSLKGKLRLKNSLFKYSTINIMFLVIFYILLGVIKQYEVYNILQELKLFLYIFIPYLYLISINIDMKLKKNMILFFEIYICIVFLQEIINILNIGITQMVSNGFGQRNVGIVVQFVPLAMSILIMYKREISKYKLYVLMIFAFLSCLLSFTRTVWMQYIISIIILMFFKDKNFIKKVRNIVLIILLIVLSIAIIKLLFPEMYIKFVNAIFSRLTDSTNSVNTLDHRFNSSIAVFYDKVFRVDSIFGSGFGEIWDKKGAVFIENSILYYIWKYGVFFTMCMSYLLIKNIYMMFKWGNNALRVIGLNLLAFIVIGNFSGLLNIYYFVPIISFVFSYGFTKKKLNAIL